MGLVVNLFGFLPPARSDDVPWTGVNIEEAAAAAGPWTQIDAQTLTPVDADPKLPQFRSITTTRATIAGGWYRVTWTDDTGGHSEPSDPVYNTPAGGLPPLPPTPDVIRNASPLLRQRIPTPVDDPNALADLQTLVSQATAQVQALTWRIIDPVLGCSAPTDYQCEAVPLALTPVAVQAITRMAERIYVLSQPDLAEQIATGRRLRGFTAGPYSESYFAPGEFARRGAAQGRAPMDPDDALDTALWALATEDARDYFVWRATGQPRPYGEASAFDYRRQTIGYGSSGPMIGAHGGPDGF